MSIESITITRPDDWHLHLRDDQVLAQTVAHSARVFNRAIVMPNLVPPISSLAAATAYRHRILQQVPSGQDFEPLMTLYLTDNLAPAEIGRAWESGIVKAVKYYPAGATTNSDNGVTGIEKVYPALELMAELGMPLLFHGEVTGPGSDIFDREKVFIDTILSPLLQRYPGLRVVLEHITTRDAVQFVQSQSGPVGATITVHHLLYNRNHMLAGGIRPHFYCLPILKRDIHQQALVEAATSGDHRFFLGTDSAPHPVKAKETACGCAGIFSAHAALELYTEVFDRADALNRLEKFASFNGPDFYRMARNSGKITLTRSEWQIPRSYKLGESSVVPLRAGEKISWRISEYS
ncbi:MAG: dihydroorotase [Gammaproteobacteria bacterium]|nr:dihydroorotase [Pseudomonadales bacterium]MCP5345831.1 dihydroorotase [Pseudomonadales bacterium]